MNWDTIKGLSGSKPLLAAAVAAVTVVGAGVNAVVNGVDIVDLLGGKAQKEQTAKVEAEAREASAMKALAQEAEARAALQADTQAWTAALETNTPDAFDFYLRAFPQGAFRQQAEGAKQRLAAAAVAPPSRASAFSLAGVHPTVSAAVTAARAAADDAAAKQAQGERIASQAAAAGQQARERARGYGVVRFRNRDLFEGELVSGKPNGLGVFVQGAAPFEGDRYQGQFADGLWNGLGVYESAKPDSRGRIRYGGEFARGHLSGAGVIVMSSGARQAGVVVDGALNGHGAETRADGRRYEGEFKQGAPDGFGAVWSADGRLIESGRYAAGALVQPM